MRTMPTCLLAAAAALVLASCGGDDDALSKSEYITKADAICKAGEKKLEALGEDLGEDGQPSPAELKDFAGEAVSILNDQIEDLRDLPAPEGDEETLDKIYDAADEGAEKIEEAADDEDAAAKLFGSESNPFEEADKLAEDYGLEECGGE